MKWAIQSTTLLLVHDVKRPVYVMCRPIHTTSGRGLAVVGSCLDGQQMVFLVVPYPGAPKVKTHKMACWEKLLDIPIGLSNLEREASDSLLGSIHFAANQIYSCVRCGLVDTVISDFSEFSE